MKITLPGLALILFGVCGVASAQQIFKYVDQQGRVHYADQPQPGWERVDVRAPTNTEADSRGGLGDGAQQAQSLERAVECARKQEQIKTYRTAARIVERDSLGRDKEYNADERQQLIAKTEAQIDDLCGTPKANGGAAAANRARPSDPAPASRSDGSTAIQ